MAVIYIYVCVCRNIKIARQHPSPKKLIHGHGKDLDQNTDEAGAFPSPSIVSLSYTPGNLLKKFLKNIKKKRLLVFQHRKNVNKQICRQSQRQD